jgi:ferric-dicitrate binding protein FerR (iron transport regulator)
MKRPACSRTWEAEAIEDDRLDPTARASFERHASTCEVCGAELERLARIRDAVRRLPEYPSQVIDRRRSRIALLQRANEHMMRGRSPRVGVWIGMAIAACALVLAIVGARWGAIRHLAVTPIRAPAFEIVDVGHANWATTTSAGTVQIALSDGTTAIHVEHLARDQRFLVQLPDGDLEVRGTRFQVSVTERRTMHLEVSEGVVALRLVGQAEVVLVAGEQWTMPASPVAADTALARSLGLPATSAQAVGSPPAALPPSPPIALASASRATAVAPSPLPAADTAAVPAESVPARGDSYAACVSAFESGDYASADLLFADFMRDNPSDARSEDAAFLRAVSHARMGDAAGAVRLAHEYLQRYPQGLRHREAERLAGNGEPQRK